MTTKDFTIIVDTREQLPLTFSNQSVIKTLKTGDYSIEGLQDKILCVERKSLPDLCQCIGNGRRRFEAELDRMKYFKYKMVVVECSWQETFFKSWRGQITPEQLQGSVLGWIGWGIPFLFAGSALGASKATEHFMTISHNRHIKETKPKVKDEKKVFVAVSDYTHLHNK